MSGDEEHKQSVSRTVPVPAERLFAVLVVPARHQEIDGSGMIRGAATTAPISAVGDIFTIDMDQEAFGQYRWSWEFSPEGGSTRVTHTCDWSGVTDERILAVLNFPRVSADQMAVSIDQLVAAATNGG
jgi:hypothetical protein